MVGVAEDGVEAAVDVEVEGDEVDAEEVEKVDELEDDVVDVVETSVETVVDELDDVAVKLAVSSVLERLVDATASDVANDDEASAPETVAVADVIPLSSLVAETCAYSRPMSLAELLRRPNYSLPTSHSLQPH